MDSDEKPARTLVNDKQFVHRLAQLRNLKSFLFEEKVHFKKEDLPEIDLGLLNNITHGGNEPPSVGEWALLDEKLTVLTAYLDPELRVKLRLRELDVFFGRLPLIFLSGSVTFLFIYLMIGRIPNENRGLAYDALFLVSLLGWTLCQGALGACAYLATQVVVRGRQAPSKEKANALLADTFDLTDRNVLTARIILGPLFSFLLATPFAATALDRVISGIYIKDVKLDASDFAFILAPFLTGFSTSLVLGIFDRVVSAVRSLFGLEHL